MTNEEFVEKINESLQNSGLKNIVAEQENDLLRFKQNEKFLNMAFTMKFLDDPEVDAINNIPDMVKDYIKKDK